MSNIFDQTYENVTRGYCKANSLPQPAQHEDTRMYEPEDETVEDTALSWLWRCRKSEEAALDVMSEIEITCHGDFVKKAMHLLSDIGPYSDRTKIVNDLEEALKGTLKACAAHE